jgi:hypothetical protein
MAFQSAYSYYILYTSYIPIPYALVVVVSSVIMFVHTYYIVINNYHCHIIHLMCVYYIIIAVRSSTFLFLDKAMFDGETSCNNHHLTRALAIPIIYCIITAVCIIFHNILCAE